MKKFNDKKEYPKGISFGIFKISSLNKKLFNILRYSLYRL